MTDKLAHVRVHLAALLLLTSAFLLLQRRTWAALIAALCGAVTIEAPLPLTGPFGFPEGSLMLLTVHAESARTAARFESRTGSLCSNERGFAWHPSAFFPTP